MYISGYFKETDLEKVKAFLRQNDFATLVSYDGLAPIASHLLVEVEEREDKLFNNGHMARANPLWRSLETQPEVLLIFSGPDTYISPRWYGQVNVPTWNYLAVHAYGKPGLITDRDELYNVLKRLIARYEPNTGYSMDGLPVDFVEKELKGVVGFRVEITRLEASSKLSQNRNDEDYANIIHELEKRTDPKSLDIARAMREKRAPGG